MPERWRVLVRGAVQGVGFRPFIYRLANAYALAGWVSNSSQGVVIEAEAPPDILATFLTQIEAQKPPHSSIQRITVENIPPLGMGDKTGVALFEIHESHSEGNRSTIILPDLATCPDCLREISDPANRRYRYPFTNCTHCGPRYSIISGLPYDRPYTTMSAFTMCEACRAEYENPLDRRFHAQPNACPHCGPHLSFWDRAGEVMATHDEALRMAAEALRKGAVVALKGMGGFQLLVDARNEDAVRRLRKRKQRLTKPFAVMIPSLAQTQALCEVSAAEEGLLTSAEAPIVLLRRLKLVDCDELAPSLAPHNPYLGVMLPYTPLHHLLLADLGFPVVATSGNLSGEPLCSDAYEALQRLKEIADYFLVHNRAIARPIDDSVARIMAGTPCVLRRARGYAPLPIELPEFPEDQPVTLAVGGHLKNTVALSVGQQVFLSQHLGDLDTPETLAVFHHALQDWQTLYGQPPTQIACDAHPDYRSTQAAQEIAQRLQVPLVHVQHHYAHIVACMAEHGLSAPILGVAWDGTGYGTDGTIWGSEFLQITPNSFERRTYLRPFKLLGGEGAIREPRRAALSLLFTLYGEPRPDAQSARWGGILGFAPSELRLLYRAWERGLNAPQTSSMGRLFDALAALLGLCSRAHFEGEAAMALEFAAEGTTTDRWYPFPVTPVTIEKGHSGRIIKETILEWGAMIKAVLADLEAGVPVGEIAVAFHRTLVDLIATVAAQNQIEQVVMSGGCFQNKRLLESSIARLQNDGFRPYWSQCIPPNDGGIALGQIVAAGRQRITPCV